MATVQPTIGLKNDAEATTSSNNHLIGTVEEALATPNEGNRNFWFVLTVVVVLPLFVIATSFVFGGLLAALEEWTWMEGFYYVVRRYTGHSVLCRLLRERLLLLIAIAVLTVQRVVLLYLTTLCPFCRLATYAR